ncbi:unnamed protein product, partial [Prunus brigantina]
MIGFQKKLNSNSRISLYLSLTFLSSSPLFPNPSRTQHSLIASFIFIFITFGRQCHHLRPLRLPSVSSLSLSLSL